MVRKKNKLELENLLTELCNRIKDHYELDEILLFGSYAKGTAKEPVNLVEISIRIMLIYIYAGFSFYSHCKYYW